jgi:hypothetical protein
MTNSVDSPPLTGRTLAGLGAILALYLVLSLGGIRFGLPDEGHLLSYNPDETTWIEGMALIQPSQGRYNPHPDFPIPTFYLMAYGAALGVGAATHWIPLGQSKAFFFTHRNLFARFYLAGRFLQGIFGLILLLAVWRSVSRWYGPPTAFWATLLLAVSPSLVAASHFSQANVPVTLLAYLSLACLVEESVSNSPRSNVLVAGAMLAGLAMSTKYSAATRLSCCSSKLFASNPVGSA